MTQSSVANRRQTQAVSEFLFPEVEHLAGTQGRCESSKSDVVPSPFPQPHSVGETAQDFVGDRNRIDNRLTVRMRRIRDCQYRSDRVTGMWTIFAKVIVIQVEATNHGGIGKRSELR